MLGRIAIKDAVRHWLWQQGGGPMFPIEVEVYNEPSGQPRVRGAFSRDLRVSVAHKPKAAVAMVAEGVDVGIDCELVEPRSDSFSRVTLSDPEKALLAQQIGCAREDEWLTRAWAAKEAVGKSRGTGLGGNPKRFEIQKIEGESLLVDGQRVQTRRHGDLIVAWTRREESKKGAPT